MKEEERDTVSFEPAEEAVTLPPADPGLQKRG
jgi:hypothetical protein